MNIVAYRWEIPLFLASTSAIALYVLFSPAIGDDWFLDPLTGLVATVTALAACSQLAQAALDRRAERLWQLVITMLALVCVANFFEPASDRLGAFFGRDDFDDYLILAVAPAILSLTSYFNPALVRARRAVWLGLAVQTLSVLLELAFEEGEIGGSRALWSLLTDFAEFLSVSLYLVAMFWIVFDTGHALGLLPPVRTRSGSAAVPPLSGRSIRDGLYPPPFILGLHLPPSDTPAGRVHRLCNQALWPTGDVIAGGRNLLLIAAWPLVAAVRAIGEVRRRGVTLRGTTGISRRRQFADMVRLAVRYRVPPLYYYRYDLYRPAQRRLAPYYLMRYQTKEIAYRLLYPRERDGLAPAPLKDKLGFAIHCERHGLSHVPTLAVFEDGRRADEGEDGLPPVDLFLKPLAGKGGFGAERWDRVSPTRYRNSRGDEIAGGALFARLSALSRSRAYLVQPALRNHPALRDLSAGALCTARILTCRTESGDYEATNAAFRMPGNAGSAVDNFHAGGVASAVDIGSGTLGPATDLGTERSRWHERHPFTGAPIAGRRLPMWSDAVALVERAHRAFGDYVLIGWDVALLESGPILVEGNRGPDIDILQRTGRGPLGNGRFGELLAYHLEHRRQAAEPARHCG